MKKIALFSWISFIPTFLISCSTVVTALNPLDGESEKTSFLLSYELTGNSDPRGNGDCDIALTQLDTKQKYSINLNPEKKWVLFEAPAGKYNFEKLSCEHGAAWDLSNFGAPEVRATGGKVNYLGRFQFKFSYRENENTHELSLARGDREETRKALLAASKNRSSRFKSRIVSAYNGKGWDPIVLESEAGYRRGTTSHVVGPKVQLNVMDFTSCESTEFKTNPAPLGALSYRVSYENHHMSQIKKVAEQNSSSPTFVTCVEEVIKKFDPGVSGKLDYDINL